MVKVGEPVSGEKIKVFVDELFNVGMEFVERIRGVCVAGDDDVPGSGCEPRLVCSPIAFAGFNDDFCSFLRGDVPRAILGIAVNNEDFKFPAVLLQGLGLDGVNGLADADFFVDGGDDDADFQRGSSWDW